MSHWYTDTPIHWIPSSSLPGCSVHSYILFVYHCYMYLLDFYILSYGSPFILHVLLLHVYSCIPVTYYFPLLILIFPLLDTWAIDMRCVELSATWIQATGATSRIPHLLFPVSRYLDSCYEHSSCPVIVLHVPCTVLVLDTLCTLNIRTITWEMGETWRLTRSYRVNV